MHACVRARVPAVGLHVTGPSKGKKKMRASNMFKMVRATDFKQPYQSPSCLCLACMLWWLSRSCEH